MMPDAQQMMPARMRTALARKTQVTDTSASPEVYTEEGCCCAGKPCGDGKPVTVRRYPTAQTDVDPAVWKQSGGAAQEQFATYADASSTLSAEPFTYAGPQLGAFAFPMGGFGAGHVVLRGDGTLQKWCVRNQVRHEALPLDCMPANFFGISVGQGGASSPTEQSFVLASPETYSADRCGLPSNKPAHASPSSVARLKSLPGIKSLSIVARYPVADVSYDIPGLPVDVSLEALSPMVPLDERSSSLPVALFQFTVKNTSKSKQTTRVLQAQQNFVGWDGQADCTAPPTPFWAQNVNTPFAESDGSAGLSMSSQSVDNASADFGTICIQALASTGTTPHGASVGLFPGASSEEELWSSFVDHKEVPASASSVPPPTAPSADGKSYCGGVVQTLELLPGEGATLTFALAWHFPNRMREESVRGSHAWDEILPPKLGNFYATWLADARHAATYARSNIGHLVPSTKAYVEAMYTSSIPWLLTDSAAGRAAVLRSPTMWKSEAGIVQGSEGNGCCPLNCSHVYGYTTLMERLFPSLAQDMRISDFVRNYKAGVGVTMRFGTNGWAIDGALASVIKTYLVVQQADPTLEFLKHVWPNVKDQMALLSQNFVDADGVIRVAQQNTYDTSMLEANTFIGSYYVTALRASAAMATLMGEPSLAAEYTSGAAKSAAAYDQICWNAGFGYYTSDVTLKTCANSYGPGCFVDQICAAGLSAACGFGACFDAAHEASARKAIAKYNVVRKPPWNDMQKHLFDGDVGITVCTYPNGKLGDGMRYDTLVSSGFTSPVIAGLLLDRNLEDAERLNGYIRQRHDGRNRTPWNEPECDLLYSRAMAHWNIFEQACGYSYDCTKGAMRFDPRYAPEKFQSFFVTGSGWGQYTQSGSDAHLSSGRLSLVVEYGSQPLTTLTTVSTATQASATLTPAGKLPQLVGVSISAGVLTFSPPITVSKGAQLDVVLSGGGGVGEGERGEGKLAGDAPHVALQIDDASMGATPRQPRQRRRPNPGSKEAGDGAAKGDDGDGALPAHPLLALVGGQRAKQLLAGLLLFVLGAVLGRTTTSL
jgi:non-lysosomal glucosylceramidase